MFLHFLSEDREKEFFLKFAYLLAVAEPDVPIEAIPVHNYTDDPEERKFAFEAFTPGFSMEISELLMLRKFAQEMGLEWHTVSSASSAPSLLPSLILPHIVFPCFPGRGKFACDDPLSSEALIKQVASKDSVPQMLETACRSNKREDRSAILLTVLTAIFGQVDARTFAVEKRKAMLMEATAIAYADGTYSPWEDELLQLYCTYCRLDKVMLSEFKGITKEFAKAYQKAIELITE